MNPERITIVMRRDEAEEIRDGLADIQCWCEGFVAAWGDRDSDYVPRNISKTRDMIRHLRNALAEEVTDK